jgi:hypothetical protein
MKKLIGISLIAWGIWRLSKKQPGSTLEEVLETPQIIDPPTPIPYETKEETVLVAGRYRRNRRRIA